MGQGPGTRAWKDGTSTGKTGVKAPRVTASPGKGKSAKVGKRTTTKASRKASPSHSTKVSKLWWLVDRWRKEAEHEERAAGRTKSPLVMKQLLGTAGALRACADDLAETITGGLPWFP